MLIEPTSNTTGVAFGSGALSSAAGFFASASIRSEKLKRPSLSLTTRALSPERLTPSTMYWPLRSGSSFTEACAESNATNCSLEAFSENVTPETPAPRLGQKASLIGPWMLRVRPVFSWARRSMSAL